ncbi:MAG: LuxR C-terminal-related transcriptional regulator [Aeromicrobium sp.]
MTPEQLRTARSAFARRDWRVAHDLLSKFRADLTTADLERLAEAAWWLGDLPDAMAASEEVYRQLLAAGELEQAADRALRLTLLWFNRGEVQVGIAWLARARHVIRDFPRCPVHGYLRYAEAAADMDLSGDPEAAEAAARDIEALALEHDEPTLESFGLALRGLAAVRRGKTPEGFANLDEAMLPVLAGRVDPLWAGDLYCTVVHLCDELGDLARMRAWTASMARWSRPKGPTFVYTRVTRVHELQVVAAEGDWTAVESELGGRSADLVGAHGWLAGEGYYTLAEVRRLRGDADGARSAYALARGLAHDGLPGEALLLEAEGRPADALAALRVGLSEATRLGRTRMQLDTVRIAVLMGDAVYAAAVTNELEQAAQWFGTSGLIARAAQARAALLLADELPTRAIPLLEQAAQIYREQRNRYANAAVHEVLAAAHSATGDHDKAAAARATAVAVYTHLGAVPDIERLAGRARRPCGLTDREAEVLTKVAAGATNRQVAVALVISEKTVSRHLTNIFTKINVGTRTAAAAWAHDNGLA